MLAPAGLFALALGVRLLPWRTVFVGESVLLFDHDAYYHLRRIVWAIAHFPRALDFDRYLAFPEGGRAIWPPAFDWLVALVALPFARPGEPASVERVAVWVPPLLGAATVLALYGLARRHFDAATALVAGAILAVLSGHFWYSQLGFVDHHAAEALASTWLLAAAMNLLDREARALRLGPAALGVGAALAASLLVWPGSLLYVAIALAGLFAAALARGDAARAAAFARALALALATALAGVLPFALAAGPTRFGPWSPLVLSWLQPLAFAGLAAVAAACALVWRRRPALGASAGARLGCAAAAALVLAALWAPALPELWRGAGDAAAWLGRRESFQAMVSESQPLLVGADGRLELTTAATRLSWLALASPLLLALAARWAWRRTIAAPLLLWVGWTAALLAVTLLQRRFFNSFSVCLALLFAWALRGLDGRLAGALAARPRARRAARAGLAALALAAFLPVAESYRLHVAALLEPAGRAPEHIAPSLVRRRAMLDLATWLRRRTPPTAGWLDPGRAPEYGVLAPWELGHIVQYVGRRPAVADNFGDDVSAPGFAEAARYYASEEAEASRILDALGVRYVVAQREPPYPGPPPGERSMFASLYYFDGREVEGPESASGLGAVPALERHRLVYESSLKLAVAPDAPALYKVFEHVPGAVLEGRAAPGARVDATLALRTNRGRRLRFATHAHADAAGRYALRVPYATRGAPPSVRAQGEYRLACDGEEREIAVDEEQVRAGARIEAPALCLPAPEPAGSEPAAPR